MDFHESSNPVAWTEHAINCKFNLQVPWDFEEFKIGGIFLL